MRVEITQGDPIAVEGSVVYLHRGHSRQYPGVHGTRKRVRRDLLIYETAA